MAHSLPESSGGEMDNGAKDKEEEANNGSLNSRQGLLQSSIILLLADPMMQLLK